MNSQQLLYFNVFFGTIIVLYFLLGRVKPLQPTKLNLKAKPVDEPKTTVDLEEEPSQVAQIEVEALHEVVLEAEILTQASEPNLKVAEVKEKQSPLEPIYPTPVKNLAIYFMFNGHEWEAHEVLGIPQGSTLQMATESYQKLIKHSDVSTYEFYELAHLAILKSKNRRL